MSAGGWITLYVGTGLAMAGLLAARTMRSQMPLTPSVFLAMGALAAVLWPAVAAVWLASAYERFAREERFEGEL